MNPVERIEHQGQLLAILVRAEHAPGETSFVTEDEHDFQVGFVVYPAGGEVARHTHLPLERHLVGTSEVILVRRGRCTVDLYDDGHGHAASRELAAGDLVYFLAGGHGFRMREDTILLEVKQGPYTGLAEKHRF